MSDFNPNDLLMGFLYYVVFLFSTTCHEAAHAFAAERGGDPTAALGGQASLNPIPHIRRSPFGMVVMPLVGFFLAGGTMIGWASAPYDPLWERRHPKRSAWMALAGPAANFSLVILSFCALRAGLSFGIFRRYSGSSLVGFLFTILMITFTLNLLLGVLNLIPVPPLDGSTAIMLFMSESTAQKYLDMVRGNSFALAGLLLALIIIREVFPFIRAIAMRLLMG